MNAHKWMETPLWIWARESRTGKLLRACGRCAREFWAWARWEEVTFPNLKQLAKSVAALRPRASDAANAERDTESPIFLFATGWRTGSTLLQRILVTDPHLLLWGEPLGELTLVTRIAEILNQFSTFPHNKITYIKDDLTSSRMATSWIATLCPPAHDFRLALRSLFDQWLGEPARHRGFARWGFKEVRLGATEASLLHWLYPRAKFVILSRHPYDCYRSFADPIWQVYYRRPELHVDSAAGFARHWNRLAVSWSELPEGFPSIHVKYEDLIKGKVDFRELESWLGIEIKEDVALSASVGGTAVRNRLNWYERLIIGHEAAAGMRALGYSK